MKYAQTGTGSPPKDPTSKQQSLQQSVTEAMQRYFSDLDGQATHDLYDIVMAEVEPPLLKAVMVHASSSPYPIAAPKC